MLKRQRPFSPFALCSDTQHVEPLDDCVPDPKRRRVFPPSLDGPSRGWGPSVDADAEEDLEDELGETQQPNTLVLPVPGTSAAEEYKSANSMLYELHALHQHRILFTNTSQSAPPLQAPHVVSIVTPSGHPTLTPNALRADSVPQVRATLKNTAYLTTGTPEDHSVNERYKDTNRLLGSLVLARRRHLDVTT